MGVRGLACVPDLIIVIITPSLLALARRDWPSAPPVRYSEEKIMLVRKIIFSLVVSQFVLSAATDQIAFLKDGHIFVADIEGRDIRQLDHDDRSKGTILWDGVRKRLAYSVSSLKGEKARLVLVDLTGRQITEFAIRPITDPPTEGLRFAEKMAWTLDGRIRVTGEINPSNCELFDYDLSTGDESKDQFGRCGTFVPSPDGKHIAELALVDQFTDEEHRFDHVDLDGKGFFDFKDMMYTGLPYDIHIPISPVWSSDSQHIAVLEKRAATGETAVVIIGLDRGTTRIAVPASMLEDPEIDWTGSMIVVGRGANAIQVDPMTKSITPVTSNTVDDLKRRAAKQSALAAIRKRVDDVVLRLGAREGVALEEQPQ